MSYFFAMLTSCIGGILGLALFYFLHFDTGLFPHSKEVINSLTMLPQLLLAIFWIPLGVSVGLFLEFIFRIGDKTDFDTLVAINPGRWRPWKRTVGTLATAYLLAFALGIELIKLGVSGIELNQFLDPGREWLAIAIGFVTGFTYPYVRDTVSGIRPGLKSVGSTDRSKADEGSSS